MLLPRFDAEQALALMQKEDITFFAGVPTMYWGLLDALDDDRRRRARSPPTCGSRSPAGSSLPVEIIKDVQENASASRSWRATGCPRPRRSRPSADPDQDPVPGSIGIPIWGVECKLIDDDWKTIEGADEVGEIAIRATTS